MLFWKLVGYAMNMVAKGTREWSDTFDGGREGLIVGVVIDIWNVWVD
jgi:hypothetical protein